MEDIKLSFIVPMYNSDKYLNLCLDSLLNQDVSYDEYEIICINDGSTDSTKGICLSYEKKYSNIYYFEQENKGLSSARNLGLTKARGRYIWFIDSDDEIMATCLNRLINEMIIDDLDVLEISYLHGREIREVKNNFKFIVANEFRSSTAWSKIIKKEILNEHFVIFNEKHTYKEDFTWSLELREVTRKMKYCTQQLYFYRENDFSLTRASDAHIKGIRFSFILFGDLNQNKITLSKINRNDVKRCLVWEIFMSSYTTEEKKQLIDFLEKHGEYPYSQALNFDFSKFVDQLKTSRFILFLKGAITGLLVVLFQYKKALVLFFYIKDVLIKDKNEAKPILDMKEIESLYYGK